MKYFIKKSLITNDYDFIQAMDVFSLEAAVSLKKRIKKPLIVDINELPDLHGRSSAARMHPFFKKFLNKRFIILAKKVDNYITTCDSLAEFTSSFLGYKPSVIKNANPLWRKKNNRNRIQEDLKFSDQAFYLVFPATAAPNYGVEETIQALKKLPSFVKLIFIGRFNTPEYKKKIQALVTQENLSMQVFFKGPYYENDYFEYLSAGDLSISPLSLAIKSHNYILPSRLLDMITAEVPIISTNIKEFFKINSARAIGIGLDHLDSFQIAKAIQKFLTLNASEKGEMKSNILQLKEVLIEENEQKKYLELINNTGGSKINKVAFVCNSGIVNNKRLINFCKILEKKNIGIDVYCIDPPCHELKKDLTKTTFITLTKSNNTLILFLSLGSYLATLLSNVYLFITNYSYRNFKSIIQFYKKFNSKQHKNAKKQLFITKTFAKNFAKETDFKPDIILLHDTLASKAGIELHKKNKDAKLVIDVTEIPDLRERANVILQNLPSKINKKFIKWEQHFIKKSALIFTLNVSFKDFMVKRYQRNDIEIIKNVRLKLSNKRKPIHLLLNLLPDDIIVVFAGTASPATCALPIITAFKKLPNHIHLLFLGEATNKDFKDKMIANVNRLKLSNRVHFHAPIYGEDYLEMLAACDMGLVVFQTDILQTKLVLPNRFLDFVAAGLPVLSTNIIDVKKYITEYNIGFCIDEINPNAIAEGISKIIQLFNLKGNGLVCSAFKERALSLQKHVSEENDFNIFSSKIKVLVKDIERPKVAFLARQRLSSNTRIARQCASLVEEGFEVRLYGINEGPSQELLAQMGNIKVEIVEIT